MTLMLSDFPKYLSEGKSFVSEWGHFFVHGSGHMDNSKDEKITILTRMLGLLENGLEECIIYSEPNDAATFDILKNEPNIIRTNNQNKFIGSSTELANLCSELSGEDISSINISVLFKLNRNKTDWKTLFSNLYDPGFLANAGSVVSPSAYKFAKKMVNNEHVYFILFATAIYFPQFLVFDKTDKHNLFTIYAVKHCLISDRFKNLYSHVLVTEKAKG